VQHEGRRLGHVERDDGLSVQRRQGRQRAS
jgi:hypothetical protein